MTKKSIYQSPSIIKKTSSCPRTPKTLGGTNAERILKAISSAIAFGNVRPEKKNIQSASLIRDKKVFSTVCATMKNKGLILYDRTAIWLTELGREQAGEDSMSQPITNEALHDAIKSTFRAGTSRSIFDILADGGHHTKEEIAQTLDIDNNKSFGTYLSALSKYTDKGTSGTYRLKDVAFPFGRPDV
jgi:hypothetical protein